MPMASNQSKSWNAKNYILAALGGTLAGIAVVIIVSAILSPARISFTVAHASRTNLGGSTGDAYLNLTVAAAINTSRRRAKVKYHSVSVDVSDSTSAVGKNTIHAQLDTKPTGEYLRGGSVTNFNASIFLVGGGSVQSFAGRGMNSGFSVQVAAQVRFKIGLSRTRLYDIVVTCPHVLFLPDNETNQLPVNCTG